MSSEDITVSFRVATGQKFDLTLDSSLTVLETKEKVEKDCNIPVSQQRLIYRGRILKDPEKLSSYGIASGHTIHVVRVSGGPQQAPQPAGNATSATGTVGMTEGSATATQPTPTVPTTTPLPTVQPTGTTAAENLLGALGGGAGLDGQTPALGPLFGENFSGMNPQAFQAFMTDPAVTSLMQELMRNPELIRTVIQANPLLSSMAGNPTIQSLLANPEVIRAAMNPEALQSMFNLQQTYNPQRPVGTQTVPGQTGIGGLGGVTIPPSTSTDAQAAAATVEELINRTFNRPAAQQPGVDDATTYQSQLRQLEEMGFIDRDANLLALQRTGGDINAAVSWLLEGGHGL